MSDKNFNLFFKGRRPLGPDEKVRYKVIGTIEIAAGSISLLLSIGGFTALSLCLLFTGIFSIVYALVGRYWIAEKNHIIINPEFIEFKNLSQKPRVIPRNTLQDVMIELNKAVFVTDDQRFKLYDFTVFKDKDLKEINVELLKVKLEANKRSIKIPAPKVK
jgi:hypothetical protein